MILCGVGKMSNPTTTEDGLMHFWFGHFMDGMDWRGGGLNQPPPPKKSMKELCQTQGCYIEV